MLSVKFLGYGELIEVEGWSGARQDAVDFAPQHVVCLIPWAALVDVENSWYYQPQLV